MRSYRAAEAAGADIIVAECGGDICWRMPDSLLHARVFDNLSNVLLLTNNALDAFGAENFLSILPSSDLAFHLLPYFCESVSKRQWHARESKYAKAAMAP